jgi:parvulin-like peptidyl-prolyl isomerase
MRFSKLKAILTGLVLCFVVTGTGMGRGSYNPNRLLVTVNGVEIRQLQINGIIQKAMQRAMLLGSPPSRELRHNMTLDAIDDMIEQTVINERIKANRILVTNDDIGNEIKKIAASKGMSVRKFIQEALPMHNTTFTDFQTRVAIGLRFDKLIEAEAGPDYFKVTDSEAKRHYKRHKKEFDKPQMVRASHIMIKYPNYPNTDRASKEDVKYVMGKIAGMAKKGKDFATLAKQYSEHKESAKKGGDLGYLTKDNMTVKQLTDVAFSLRAGEISDVIVMPYGCHILKVFEVQKGGQMTFEEVKPRIFAWIKDDLKGRYSAKYIEQQMSKAKIRWPEGRRPKPMVVKDVDTTEPTGY